MKDLFAYPEKQPKKVREIINHIIGNNDEISYFECEELVKQLEQVGYTCDYGLDSVPFGLQKISPLNQ